MIMGVMLMLRPAVQLVYPGTCSGCTLNVYRGGPEQHIRYFPWTPLCLFIRHYDCRLTDL